MGWLRDLMAAAEPKLRSYGELARQCLEHDAWPGDIQPQARSLASLFSKFDRGIEVEWLDDRPEVQVVLAAVLSVPAPTLESEVRKHTERAPTQQNRYRLPDAPQSRPLDLRQEELPPGLPKPLLHPALWKRTWWRAGPGDGAELLAHWLRARGLAEVVSSRSLEELEPALATGHGPLYVVLPALVHEPAFELMPERPICIAAAGPAPEGFDVCLSPAPRDLVPEWLHWLAPLLPREGHFDQQRALEWLNGLWARGLPCTFETVLGLVAFADEVGDAVYTCTSLDELARRFLSGALQRAREAGAPETDWLQAHCLDVLSGMCRNAATSGEPWDVPRSHAQWLALVPPEYHRGVDAEWTRLSLQQAGAPLTVHELENALKAIPPGAFRVISALSAARLLRQEETGLRFGPAWLSALVNTRGRASLLDAGAFEWGEVALRGEQFDWVLEALEAKLEAGHSEVLDAALEMDDDDSPGFVLAVELLVLAAGRACLLDREFDNEQVSNLLVLQRDFALEEAAGVVAPRLLCGTANRALYGQWLLACWALSEQSESAPKEESPLDPWSNAPLGCSLEQLEFILAALTSRASDDGYVRGAYALLGRLLQHCERRATAPDSSATEQIASRAEVLTHPLFAVARALRGEGWNAWEQAQLVPEGIESVHALVTPDAWPYIAKGAWRAWIGAGLPETGVSLFDGTGPRAMLFWPHLPDHVLRQLLDSRVPLVLTVPAPAMKDDWVTMYLERVPEERDDAIRYLKLIPMQRVTEEHFEVLFELLESHHLLELGAAAWRAHPESVLAHVTHQLDQGKAQSRLWLQCAPQLQRKALLEHIHQKLQTQGAAYPSLTLCRRWLHEACTERGPEWPASYELLTEMERRLKRANLPRVSN